MSATNMASDALAPDLARRTIVTECCWWWTGSTSKKYRRGRMTERAVLNRRGSGTKNAARYVVEDREGRQLHRWECVLHSCDNPLCVRPDHLRIGSHGDNSREARDRGLLRPGGGFSGVMSSPPCCVL